MVRFQVLLQSLMLLSVWTSEAAAVLSLLQCQTAASSAYIAVLFGFDVVGRYD
jgi:hypothetical protein